MTLDEIRKNIEKGNYKIGYDKESNISAEIEESLDYLPIGEIMARRLLAVASVDYNFAGDILFVDGKKIAWHVDETEGFQVKKGIKFQELRDIMEDNDIELNIDFEAIEDAESEAIKEAWEIYILDFKGNIYKKPKRGFTKEFTIIFVPKGMEIDIPNDWYDITDLSIEDLTLLCMFFGNEAIIIE